MKLTKDAIRIEQAHYLLQRLEDQIVGDMKPATGKTLEQSNAIYANRLEALHKEVWKVIECLNEAYDKAGD